MSKRNDLTLEEKVAVINKSDHENISQRQLSKEFHCSVGQINSILKLDRKRQILEEYEHSNSKRKRFVGDAKLDEICRRWLSAAVSKGLPVDGPTLQAKAKQFARELQIPNFAASNGWLEKFRKRFNIRFRKQFAENLIV